MVLGSYAKTISSGWTLVLNKNANHPEFCLHSMLKPKANHLKMSAFRVGNMATGKLEPDNNDNNNNNNNNRVVFS